MVELVTSETLVQMMVSSKSICISFHIGRFMTPDGSQQNAGW